MILSCVGMLTHPADAFGSTSNSPPTSAGGMGTIPFAFKGAYASYQTTSGTLNGVVNYTISSVDFMDQRMDMTISFSEVFNQPVYNNSISFYNPQPFPALSQANLQSLDQGQTSSDLGYGKVNTGVKITVPAGTFNTVEVTIPNGAPVVEISGVMWVEMSSGLIVRQVGSIRGYQNVVMELASTNIPMGGPSLSSPPDTSGIPPQTDPGPSGILMNIIGAFANFLGGVSSIGGNLKFLNYAFSGPWSIAEVLAILILPMIAVVLSVVLRVRRHRHLEINSPGSGTPVAAAIVLEAQGEGVVSLPQPQAPVAAVSGHMAQVEAEERSERESTIPSRSSAEVSMETLDKLDKVKSLLDSGAVTSEEFGALKASILRKNMMGSFIDDGEFKKLVKVSDPHTSMVEAGEGLKTQDTVTTADVIELKKPIPFSPISAPVIVRVEELKTRAEIPPHHSKSGGERGTENSQGGPPSYP